MRLARTPNTSGAEAPSFLGQGVGISYSDQSAPGRGLIGNARLNALLRRLAEERGIPHQLGKQGFQYLQSRGGTRPGAFQHLLRGRQPL